MMDSTIWGQVVRRYFQAAAALLDPANLRAGSFQRDQAAIKAASGRDRPVLDVPALIISLSPGQKKLLRVEESAV